MASSPAARDALRLALCVLLALVAWGPSLVRSGFSYDDREAVQGNPVVEGGAPASQAFLRDYWDHRSPAGHYRPLASLSLRLDQARWGTERGAGWHATGVALHALVVLLAGLLLSALAPRGALPWIGLALFAAHPLLADSVAWISGRSSMISAAGGLAGALALAHLGRRRHALQACAAALGLALALFGKEDGVVFALLFGLVAARAGRRAVLAAALGCAVGLALYLALRARALGSPWPSAPHAPLAGVALGPRLHVAGRALLEMARLAVAPVHYPPSFEGADFLEAPAADAALGAHALALAGWLAWLGALALGLARARRRPDSPAGWGLALAACALVPVLQWIPSGTVLAPRFLYLPLLFAAPALHALCARLPARGRAWTVAALLLACVLGAWQRAGVYASRASFHGAVLAQRPRHAPSWNELGLAHEEAGDLAAARECFDVARQCDPGYSRPWSNLARLDLQAGELEAALAGFERAALLGPQNATAQHNLGVLLLRVERADEALAAFERALALAPRRADSQRARARALLALGRADEARAAAQRALRLDPGDASARRLLETLAP